MRVTATYIIALLRQDNEWGSGWVKDAGTGTFAQPKECYLDHPKIWVRANGRAITGSLGIHTYGRWDAWRIARAVRKWAKRRKAG